eukprot:g288.t1
MRFLKRVFLCVKSDPEVAVIGAGPVGLVLANLLGSFHVNVLVLEKDHHHIPQHPKAHFINHRTMEILRPYKNLSDQIQKQTPALEEWRRFVYCETLTKGVFGTVDHFHDQSTAFQLGISPEPLAHLSQNKLLSLLFNSTRNSNYIQVLFGQEVTKCKSSKNGVEICVKSGQFRERKFHSQYAVIANGANSDFLRNLGLKTQSMGVLQNLLSVHFHSQELSSKLQNNPAMIYFVFNSHVVLVLVVHNLEEGEFVAQIPYFPPLQKPADFDMSLCTELIQNATGSPLNDLQIQSIQPWRMKTEVAESFQKDRVLLAGDSAHVFPPAGGFGMNTGIQDAHNLAWKLASVLKGFAGEDLLESYTKERLPVVQGNARLSVENWRNAMEIPAALGLHPGNAELLNRVISGPLSALLPETASRKLLEAGLAAGRQLSGYRGPLMYWRKRRVSEILKTGQSLKLQFPKEDLGFVYYNESPNVKKRGSEFIPEIKIGGRFPHCFLRIKTSGKIVSSLDIILWSELRYTLFFNASNSDLIAFLKTIQITTQITLVLVRSTNEKPVLRSMKYIPFQVFQNEDGIISSSGISQLEVLDVEGMFKQWITKLGQDVVLVRPDGHVTALAHSANLKSVDELLTNVLRKPHSSQVDS